MTAIGPTFTSRKPRFNHVAMSLPAKELDAEHRRLRAEFYGDVFGFVDLDMMTIDEQRQVLTFFSGNTRLGRPLMAPPDVPSGRVAALRRAFDATMRDKAFLKEAQTMGFEVSPQNGERIAALIAGALATPPDIVLKAQRAATLN